MDPSTRLNFGLLAGVVSRGDFGEDEVLSVLAKRVVAVGARWPVGVPWPLSPRSRPGRTPTPEPVAYAREEEDEEESVSSEEEEEDAQSETSSWEGAEQAEAEEEERGEAERQPQVVTAAPIDVDALACLSNEFPPKVNGVAQPSAFQAAILDHMQEQRSLVGHSHGVVVLCTGLGKTVLAAIDVQRAVERIRASAPARLKPEALTPLSRRRRGVGAAAARRSSDGVSFANAGSQQQQQQQQQQEPAAKRARAAAAAATEPPPQGEETVWPFRFLFLVHTRHIRDQAFDAFSSHFRALGFPASSFHKVALEQARRQAEDGRAAMLRAQFVFCLFQSFPRGVASFGSLDFTHVVVDEVHHLMADTYRAIHEQLLRSPALEYMMGMTATLLHRDDPTGAKLQSMFRHCVYVDFPFLLAKSLGYFPEVEWLECVPTLARGRDVPTYAEVLRCLKQVSDVGVTLRALDRSLCTLGMRTDTDLRGKLGAEYVAGTFEEILRNRAEHDLPERRRTLVFAASAKAADEVVAALQRRGFAAAAVHYQQKRNENNLRRFREGRLSVLVAVSMLSEGFDLPAVDCCVLARITESETVFLQQLGRGLRKEGAGQAGKVLTVVDLALNLRRRWKRLREEVPDAMLFREMKDFYRVENFVGSGV